MKPLFDGLGDETTAGWGTNKKLLPVFLDPWDFAFAWIQEGMRHGGSQSMTAEALDALRHPSAHIQIRIRRGGNF